MCVSGSLHWKHYSPLQDPLPAKCLGHFELKTLLLWSSTYCEANSFFSTRPSNWPYVQNQKFSRTTQVDWSPESFNTPICKICCHTVALWACTPLAVCRTAAFWQCHSEDCELMQLNTVMKSSPRMQMPSFGHSTIHSIPRVTLMHLAANAIPLGLHITGQEFPQKLVRLSSSLVMSLLGFLEHLLGLNDLQLGGLLLVLGT